VDGRHSCFAVMGDSFGKNTVQACYTGYTNDAEQRMKSSSGGLVTTILIELIKNRGYEYVFILDDVFYGHPARLQAVNDEERIRHAAGSKYIVASAYNIGKMLLNHRERGGIPKIAITGTPCLIKSIRAFMKVNDIQDDNILFLGLFCEFTMCTNVLRYYKDHYGDYSRLLFRAKKHYQFEDYRGDIIFEFVGKPSIIVPLVPTLDYIKNIFILPACLSCNDSKLNPYADISFGDCHIPVKRDRKGNSSVIIYTKKGERVWNECKNLMEIDEESLEAIKNSQFIGIKKPNTLFQRMIMFCGKHYNYYAIQFMFYLSIAIYKLKINMKIARGIGEIWLNKLV
jgi:coenzyme F420-reducing hydrogenase beta subunit